MLIVPLRIKIVASRRRVEVEDIVGTKLKINLMNQKYMHI